MKWWDVSWNPVTGCTHASEGCDHCYAERLHNQRHKAFSEMKRVPECYSTPFERVVCHSDRLDAPMHWRKPKVVFVNSMGDLFHAVVPDKFISDVWCTMADCPQHTFIICTKRAQRMRHFLAPLPGREVRLPNVWLGVTAENQARLDERLPLLCQTPAAVRFLSVEPMLGPVNIRLAGTVPKDWGLGYRPIGDLITWVICGGESGPGARPCDVAWVRSVVRQCREAGVACFVKQLGARPVRYECASGADCTHPDCGDKMPRLKSPKGGDPAEWPEDLRVREFPVGHQ